MSTIFLTGFPGFLGSKLVGRLLERYAAETTISCLIQAKFRAQAEERAQAIEERNPAWVGRIRLYEGDITLPDLGLGEEGKRLQAETIEVYHLAAVYDLAVKRAIGMRVNVDGTRYTLHFAKACPQLQRFQYVSTCYVSGSYDGTFREEELQKGQSFNNYYEETKYLAELNVQHAMREGLPVTIYRPAITVGDSQTGATQKYDGPYYIMQWMLRLPNVSLLPFMGNAHHYEVNIVPSNFVVDAISYLSSLDSSKNKVYHLCDPKPPTVAELLKILKRATQRRLILIPTLKTFLKSTLAYAPGIKQLTGIQAASIDYFVHPTRYTCHNTQQDLQGSGIACPPFEAYVDRLIKFMQEHPDGSVGVMM